MGRVKEKKENTLILSLIIIVDGYYLKRGLIVIPNDIVKIITRTQVKYMLPKVLKQIHTKTKTRDHILKNFKKY